MDDKPVAHSLFWEIFLDESYYYLWCVRPVGDTEWGSAKTFHFVEKRDAEAFKVLAEKSF